MENSKPLVLVHHAMPPFDSGTTLDIMLSPQFYTLKRENLPVRFHYQAKKLAPSILEDLLPEEKAYEYYVFKEEEEGAWVFIAYDSEEISSFLQSRGINAEQVSKLYFTQQVAERFSVPVRLDAYTSLSTVQHTATVIPKILLPKEARYQDFNKTFKPKTGVSFAAGSHSIIRKKDAWVIGAIFLIFALMFAIEGIRYRQAIEMMQEKATLILADYPALQSQYARTNIAEKYQKIDKEERHKRETLKGLSLLILPGVEVESLLMEGKHFSVTLRCPDENSLLRVQSLAKETQYQASRIGSENLVKIKGSL